MTPECTYIWTVIQIVMGKGKCVLDRVRKLCPATGHQPQSLPNCSYCKLSPMCKEFDTLHTRGTHPYPVTRALCAPVFSLAKHSEGL